VKIYIKCPPKKKEDNLCVDCKEASRKVGNRCEPCAILYHEEIMAESDLESSFKRLEEEQ
jgi:hypothetical protein